MMDTMEKRVVTRVLHRVGTGLRALGPRLRHLAGRLWRTRRGKFLVALLCFVIVNTGLETYTMRRFPSTTVTTYLTYADSQRAADYFPTTFWVFLPGRGIDFSTAVESTYAPLIHATGQSFTVAPSPARIDPAEIASVILERVTAGRANDEVPVRVRLYGISMGGMLAWDVAHALESSGRNVIVDGIVFDSSPQSPNDVPGWKNLAVRIGAGINRLPNLPGGIPNPLKGGPLDRFLMHTAESVVGHIHADEWPLRPEDVPENWRKATLVTGQEMTEQLNYIDSFYPEPKGDSLPNASFAYLRAQDWRMDTTVDTRHAVNAYADLVAPAKLRVYDVIGGDHASADRTPGPYREVLGEFIQTAGYRTIADIDADRIASPVLPRP